MPLTCCAPAGCDGASEGDFLPPTGPEAARLLDGAVGAVNRHTQAVEKLATAVRETPAELGHQSQLLRHAFDAGLVVGIFAGLIVGVILGLFAPRSRA